MATIQGSMNLTLTENGLPIYFTPSINQTSLGPTAAIVPGFYVTNSFVSVYTASYVPNCGLVLIQNNSGSGCIQVYYSSSYGQGWLGTYTPGDFGIYPWSGSCQLFAQSVSASAWINVIIHPT